MSKYMPILALVTSASLIPVWALPLSIQIESPTTDEIETHVDAKNHPHTHTHASYYKDGTYVLEYRDEYGNEIAEVFPARGLPYSMEVNEPTWKAAYDSSAKRQQKGSATWELLRW